MTVIVDGASLVFLLTSSKKQGLRDPLVPGHTVPGESLLGAFA